MNMLVCEYNYAEDIATQREGEHQIAFAESIDRGAYQKAFESARLLKQLGDSIQKITHVTGLSEVNIENL